MQPKPAVVPRKAPPEKFVRKGSSPQWLCYVTECLQCGRLFRLKWPAGVEKFEETDVVQRPRPGDSKHWVTGFSPGDGTQRRTRIEEIHPARTGESRTTDTYLDGYANRDFGQSFERANLSLNQYLFRTGEIKFRVAAWANIHNGGKISRNVIADSAVIHRESEGEREGNLGLADELAVVPTLT